jgi:CRP/FNR family cyclic AMP-dependent transcriptional regulator
MPALSDPHALANLDLFRGLSTTELTRINSVLGRTKFPAGATIMTATQPGEAAYIVQEGTIKVSVIQETGQELILAVIGVGEVVGELAMADREGRSADVVALEPSTLLWIDRTTFDQLRRDIPAVTENLIRLMARRLRVANAQLQAIATLDVHGRVARQILLLADVYGEELPNGDVRVPLRLTQGDLAGLVGATRVRVNEVLVGFKKRKYVSVDGRYRVTVHNRDALAAHYL